MRRLTWLAWIVLAIRPTLAGADGLPDWSGWWTYATPLTDEMDRNPPPLRPEKLARRLAGIRNDAPDPMRYCRPPQFTGSSDGFVGALEFLFTPGRVTLTTESGMIRRIYTDGRPVPVDPVPTNMGTSVGHWEGATLVIETVGLNPESRYPNTAQGNLPLGRNALITERIRLIAPDTLEIAIETIAPELMTRPDRRTRIYKRRPELMAAREITFCVDHDRAIDPLTGAQRFDLTPPTDLPPPPAR
jgi:hypothetical protein